MAKPTLFMGTTKIAAEKTAHEIMSVLVASGARQIATDYDQGGKIRGLRFIIEVQGVQLAFTLPVRVDPLVKDACDPSDLDPCDDYDDNGGIERTYLCCGRTVENGHSDSCHERIDDDFLERAR